MALAIGDFHVVATQAKALLLRRRDLGLAALALGATAALPGSSPAQGLAEKLRKDLNVEGDLKDLADDARAEVAYVYGMEAYVYGFPLVIMDVTRAVTTAASKSGEYSAPINQFGRMRTYVDPNFKNVVRITRAIQLVQGQRSLRCCNTAGFFP